MRATKRRTKRRLKQLRLIAALTVTIALAVVSDVALTEAASPAKTVSKEPTATPAPVMTRDPRAGLYKPTPTPRPLRPDVVMMSFPSVDIEADTKDVWVYFPNSEKNEGWYDLAFTLWAAIPVDAIEEGIETTVLTRVNEETGEEEEVVYAKLFSSGLVPAGYCLQEVTMNQPVPEGSYSAILTAQPYDVTTGQPTQNSGSTFITLNAYRTETAEEAENTEAPVLPVGAQ